MTSKHPTIDKHRRCRNVARVTAPGVPPKDANAACRNCASRWLGVPTGGPLLAAIQEAIEGATT